MAPSRLYALPEELRPRLKEPFGTLIPNEGLSLKEVLAHTRSAKLIVSVGDATTDTLLSLGITPSLQVVDGREMRSKRSLPRSAHRKEVRTSNPPGHISSEALEAVSEALGMEKPVRIVVEGEEDLLALPIVATYPLGTAVLYGQPGAGVVVVKVSQKKRRMALSFLKEMGIEPYGQA